MKIALLALVTAITLFVTVPKQITTPVATAETTPVVVKPEPAASSSPAPSVDNSFESSKTIHNLSVTPENTVFVLDEINESSLAIAQEITEKSKKVKDLYVLINSPGGSVLDGTQIVAAIQASQAKVHTVCLQLCASMGSIIHAYGHERLMMDRAILMNHQAALQLGGPIEIVRSRLGTLYRYTQKLDKFIADRAGITLEQFNLMFSNEQWIDSEDATAQKFNDKIVHLDLSALNKAQKQEVRNSMQQTKLKLKMGF